MKFLYNIFIVCYPIIAKIIASNNAKAKLWVAGRNNIFDQLKIAFSANHQPVIWMHCSSLGEFEQGRPVAEQLKQQYPNHKLLITFFSPSGYEVQKNYTGADWVFYLPMDNATNASKFLDIVNPSMILFVKYEFWFYYLQEAKQRNIPLLLISGIFRANQPFFKWYGSFHKQMLRCFTHVFVQNNKSQELLNGIGFTEHVSISGDTRFDRVIAIANNFSPIEAVEQFIGNSPVIVAGSTWTEDDLELAHFANTHTEVKCIIAPHDISKSRLDQCLNYYKNAVLFSEWKTTLNNNHNYSCLIIDNIGMLSKLYHYATICYIGGGFGNDGVHNVLEAAVYKKPVVFGPEYEKFVEATELLETDGATSIDSAIELEATINELLNDTSTYKKACNDAGNYVISKAGATNKIVSFIYENRLLTN